MGKEEKLEIIKYKSKYLKSLGFPFEKLKYNFGTFFLSSVFFNTNIAQTFH